MQRIAGTDDIAGRFKEKLFEENSDVFWQQAS
jgi:hypothetical protein